MDANTSKFSTFINSKPVVIAKKVLWGVLYGLFGLIIAVLVWLAVDKFILKSPVPSAFGYATLIVETGSMESTLQIGDMILIKDTGEYKIGDIITYLHEGDRIPTTHRIIGYTDNGYITKGDNNNVKDTDSVTDDIILGEMVEVFPKVGLFSKWVKEEGWMYIGAILIIVALGGFVMKSDDDDQPTEVAATADASTAVEPKEENNAQPEQET